ncbi:efflux RND transporter periplasmic adaptor subunit [Zunongwangia endophytica]|uniref:Efflux RND transporter periplasmic adaptor subunit n=1 Tax=Zunongwangia endophytica TaxID=1808945 RepID=A0ABV8H5L9_9FLAO|nr:efflux RND transporter periplasmic adaptor subunit [Zunongwangia endophytica]MDN3595154.1 efflux RND transporter periplasmic adaptor subunit [Zunongwangia endophytica]
MKLIFFLRKNSAYPLVVTMLLMISTLTSCNDSAQKKQEATAYRVSVQKVTGSKGSEQFNYSGNLEADNTVSLSFSVNGRVQAIYAEEGQHVNKGQLLASLEQTRYQSAFAVAEANYTRAEDQLKRSQDLFDLKSLPERDLVVTKANKAQAKANMNLAAKDLEDTKLVAPFTGIITKKVTESGAMQSPGSPAFILTKTNVMYATASISESDIAHVSIGDSVEVEIPALNEKRTSQVSILVPQADNYSRTFEVKVKLDNNDGAILPGMLSKLHINTGISQDRISIPTTSILKDTDNIAYVFLAQPNKTAIKKRITIERATGMNQVIISSGLQEGDLLITEGNSKLVDGSPIQY